MKVDPDDITAELPDPPRVAGDPHVRKRAALISSDPAVIEILRSIPVGLDYEVHSPHDPQVVAHILQREPDVVITVQDKHSLFSARFLCEQIKFRSSIPLVYVHPEDYGDSLPDVSAFADVESYFPTKFGEWVNLIIEIIRSAYRTPQVVVEMTYDPAKPQVTPESLAKVLITWSRSLSWTLIFGLILALLSAGITLLAGKSPEQSAEIGVIVLSAITGAETGARLREHMRRRRDSRN